MIFFNFVDYKSCTNKTKQSAVKAVHEDENWNSQTGFINVRDGNVKFQLKQPRNITARVWRRSKTKIDDPRERKDHLSSDFRIDHQVRKLPAFLFDIYVAYYSVTTKVGGLPTDGWKDQETSSTDVDVGPVYSRPFIRDFRYPAVTVKPACYGTTVCEKPSHHQTTDLLSLKNLLSLRRILLFLVVLERIRALSTGWTRLEDEERIDEDEEHIDELSVLFIKNSNAIAKLFLSNLHWTLHCNPGFWPSTQTIDKQR